MVEDPRLLRRDIVRLQQAVRQIADALPGMAGPAQVAALTAALTAVNAKTQRVGATVGPLPTGNVDVVITWPNAWPDTAYGAIVNIISGTGALGSLEATLKVGSKTTTDCTVTVANTGVVTIASFAVDVVGIRT